MGRWRIASRALSLAAIALALIWTLAYFTLVDLACGMSLMNPDGCAAAWPWNLGASSLSKWFLAPGAALFILVWLARWTRKRARLSAAAQDTPAH